MLMVFDKNAKETQVQFPEGIRVTLKELVEDYERLLKEKPLVTSKLKVGEWFRIDRETIRENKARIHMACNLAGDEGKALWRRFEKSNKIADENPDKYRRLIETYIFEHDCCEYKTEQELRDMCEEIGDGMCDEVICDLELQMRIAGGEPVDDLVNKADKLPNIRVIQLRDGETGLSGGNGDRFNHSPACIRRFYFLPNCLNFRNVAYAFRFGHSQN